MRYKYCLVYSSLVCEKLGIDKTVVLLAFDSLAWSVRPYVGDSPKAYYSRDFNDELSLEALMTGDGERQLVDGEPKTNISHWTDQIRRENRRRGFVN